MELRDGDLVLREWTADDVPALVAGINDPDIAHWIPLIPYPYTEEDAHAFLRGDVAPGEYRLAITLEGDVVGGIGMAVNSNEFRGTIGYWVAAPARGYGVCTRALRLLCRYGHEELELQRLELITDPDNHAS